MNKLTPTEKHDLLSDFVACSIAAVLLVIFLIVYQAVSVSEASHKPACTDIYQHSSSPRVCDE